eukprot:8026005-Pyramimonas_sp.AAC.1
MHLSARQPRSGGELTLSLLQLPAARIFFTSVTIAGSSITLSDIPIGPEEQSLENARLPRCLAEDARQPESLPSS